ncbi:MAG: DUF4258 domain-containing protein [Candidatus Acididesulfobacter diazotrophicus]|jgi:hypothetical protein|uniref:DUF4258 domain-containing protein n=1 Tax=Candidatus Acididesulfobacter diazotrophicus TaxID=2597226 RepID=A0A519BM57_9DELT|nr:MAG: DUF4258 domain-containing protein [Candidatus Acididesulfobacter diazotrophicus]
MIDNIRNCFKSANILYTKHAMVEMRMEEFGEIREIEVFEAILKGHIIESYTEDEPYPSCLINGKTNSNKPLHIVCAYDKDDDLAIVITVYQPNPDKWIDFERRKK